MEIIRGVPVTGGIVMGKILRFSSAPLSQKTLLQKLSREFHDLDLGDIGRIKILRDSLYEKISGRENIETEVKNLKKAVREARNQLDVSRKKLAKDISPKFAEIIDFQVLALKDTNIYRKAIELIREYNISSYLALSIIFNERIELLRKSNNEKFKNRTYDLVDLYNRLVSRLKQESGESLEDGIAGDVLILAASRMYPTDLAEIDLKKVKAIVVERQNIQSHTSILIRSLKVPYLIKTEKPVRDIKDRSEAIIDCYKGILIIQPDKGTLEKYKESPRPAVRKYHRKDIKAGEAMQVFATVNTLEEAAEAARIGVDGIGLFRTELSFLNRDIGLKLKDQVSAYKKILEMFPKKTVIIRTLDLGGDKSSFLNLIYKEELPERKKKPLINKLYSRQMEALIAASASGKLVMAFPMISRPEDIISLKERISDIRGKDEDLPQAGIPICAFIESPAAVYNLDAILDHCDHINVGTNDLFSLIYARSRQVSRPSGSQDYLQPPTIKVLGDIIETSHSKGRKVTICGGMTSGPKFLPILAGLGADSISVELKRYRPVRDLLYRTDTARCRVLVERLKKARDKKEIIRELSLLSPGL
jgi:phosphoenolpyruvate-protein phosphotransferase (PTS system enzyme I)